MSRSRSIALLAGTWLLLTAGTACRYAIPHDRVIPNITEVPFFNLGITDRPAEIRIPIPPSSEVRYLIVDNPHVNTLQVDFQNRPEQFHTGDYFPFTQRPIPHRLFVVPVKASASPDTANLSLAKSGENLSFHIRLLDTNQWQAFRDKDNSLSGIVMGFYLFLFLFSVFIVLIVRSRKSVILAGFVLFTSAWMVNDAGIFFQHLWPENPELHNRSRGIFSSLNMFAFGLYVYQDIHRQMAWGLSRVTQALIGYLAIKFLFLLLVRAMELPDGFKQFTLLFNGIAFTIIFGWYIVNILYRLKDYREAVFEALGILVISVYSFLLSLRELGISPAPIPGMHGYDVFLFHALQSLFIGLQVFVIERNKQIRNAKDMLDFKLDQERRLGEKLLLAEETEKKRIARDIHDEIGSIFVSLKYMVLSFRERFTEPAVRESLEKIQHLADTGIRKQYGIIDDLLLQPDEGKSLRSILQEKADLLADTTPLHIIIQYEADEKRISPFQKTQMHRILSELMANTIKHARAHEIEIALRTDEAIHIRYADDGIGFHTSPDRKGMGLLNIRHRLEFMRGTMAQETASAGTHFIIRIPFEHESSN